MVVRRRQAATRVARLRYTTGGKPSGFAVGLCQRLVPFAEIHGEVLHRPEFHADGDLPSVLCGAAGDRLRGYRSVGDAAVNEERRRFVDEGEQAAVGTFGIGVNAACTVTTEAGIVKVNVPSISSVSARSAP